MTRTSAPEAPFETTDRPTPPPVPVVPSEADTVRVLHRAHRWTRSYSWWGERMRDGWFLRFAPGPTPADAPSWLVMDDGAIMPVHRTDTLEQARDRGTAAVRSL